MSVTVKLFYLKTNENQRILFMEMIDFNMMSCITVAANILSTTNCAELLVQRSDKMFKMPTKKANLERGNSQSNIFLFPTETFQKVEKLHVNKVQAFDKIKVYCLGRPSLYRPVIIMQQQFKQ